jgi:hypothetical protein
MSGAPERDPAHAQKERERKLREQDENLNRLTKGLEELGTKLAIN